MSEFEHPQLGRLKHINEEGVLNFRGLKYASLENALADPRLFSCLPGEAVDATQYGPTAISPPVGCDMELGLIQKSLPHKEFASSATECLNLNISIPSGCKRGLPVFLFLHGGGFRIGSNAWPQYHLDRFVKLSNEIGTPVIGVQANYRLGVYGFLDSLHLRKAGVKANRGLRDQRTALKWIQQYIGGFGGDPNQVTVIGESAGGVSCTLQLQSSEPLFNQMVSMGGTSLLMKPLPPVVAELSYRAVLSKLLIDEQLPPHEQLKALLGVPPEDVLSKVGPDVALLPVADGEIITSDVNFAQFSSPDLRTRTPGADWCRRVMLGDCKFDGNILEFALLPYKGNLVARFQQCMRAHLSDNPGDLNSIYTGYNIALDIAEDDAMRNILSFVTDVQFYAPTVTLARAWPQHSFVYHFNEPNPWEGPYKGHASHILDVAFLFQNFNDYLEPGQTRSAVDFAKHVIAFINGKDPFPVHKAHGGAFVYGSPYKAGGNFVESEDPSDYGRSALVWQLAARFGWDKLSTALDMFIAGQ